MNEQMYSNKLRAYSKLKIERLRKCKLIGNISSHLNLDKKIQVKW